MACLLAYSAWQMDIPRIIDDLQKVTGWSQGRLAERIGANQTDVSRWLKKGREPRGHTMEALRKLAIQHGVLDESSAFTGTAVDADVRVDVRAELAEVFSDLVKADEGLQRTALKALRRLVYGATKSRPINTKGSS